MKKKKISLLGIILFILYLFIEITNIDLSKLTLYFNEEEINPNVEEVEVIELNDSELKVYYLDVGQADSVLIQNENENMLIDAGNNEDGEKLVTYLKSLGITNFKYVVGTHPHEDHIGGLDDIIKSFEIENVLMPDVYTTTSTFVDVIDALEEKKMSITIPEKNEEYILGNAKVNILYSGENVSDLNDASIVLKLIFGNNSFLFSGDATSTVEKQLLNDDLQSDVYKVAHHGSNTSNSSNFLDKVNPKYGIISCGKNNSYGHPHTEILERLEKRNIKLYRTDELGTILVTSDGNNIEISNFNTDTNG